MRRLRDRTRGEDSTRDQRSDAQKGSSAESHRGHKTEYRSTERSDGRDDKNGNMLLLERFT